MDFCKNINLWGIHIYVSSFKMKRVKDRQTLFYRRQKKLTRIKHDIFKQNGGRCEECGRPFHEDRLQVHHIVPVSERPELYSASSNIQLVCPECHARLHRDGKE